MPGDSVDFEIGSASIKHQKPRVWENHQATLWKATSNHAAGFYRTPSTNSRKKRNGKWTQFVPETSPGNHGRFTTGLFVFYEPPKTDMDILYGTWKCTPHCQRRNIYVQTTTLVSLAGFFTSFFFQEIQKENQKKKLEQHTIRRPLGQFLCGLRNFLHQLLNSQPEFLQFCFLKWMNKWVIFCHVDSGNLPTNDWERGGEKVCPTWACSIHLNPITFGLISPFWMN